MTRQALADAVVSKALAVPGAMADVARMAQQYPHPHNVLGKPGAAEYVAALAESSAAGWYVLPSRETILAAAHLAPYGGDGKGHSLWKIRHLLGARSTGNIAPWTTLLVALRHEALIMKPGTAKLVLFLGEHEAEATKAALMSGFAREGRFRDFYRLGEACLVFGRTDSK